MRSKRPRSPLGAAASQQNAAAASPLALGAQRLCGQTLLVDAVFLSITPARRPVERWIDRPILYPATSVAKNGRRHSSSRNGSENPDHERTRSEISPRSSNGDDGRR